MVIASTGEDAITKQLDILDNMFYEDEGLFVLDQSSNHDENDHGGNIKKIPTVEKYMEFFDLRRTVEFLAKGGFKRVALQFPDELLVHSSFVCFWLQEQLKIHSHAYSFASPVSDAASASSGNSGNEYDHYEEKTNTGSSLDYVSVFILADTSYGSCCVDEVAAQHGNADVIVHYGDACLTRTERLPVYYVFGKRRLDISVLLKTVNQSLEDCKHHDIVMISDPVYQHYMSLIFSKLENDYGFEKLDYVSFQQFNAPSSKDVSTSYPIANKSCTSKYSQENGNQTTCCNASSTSSCCAIIYGSITNLDKKSPAENSTGESQTFCQGPTASKCRNMSDTKDIKDSEHQHNISSSLSKFNSIHLNSTDTIILYIGKPSYSLSSLLVSHSQHDLYNYDPSSQSCRLESAQVNKFLMRRYFMIQQAKEAEVIGIVIGTLGIANYMSVIDQLIKLIQKANKKYYLFSVGKLSPAKLGNFLEIDVFVMIACPQNILTLDQQRSEYMKPIITPFELLVAMSSQIIGETDHENQDHHGDLSINNNWIPRSKDEDGLYVTDFTEIIERINRLSLSSNGNSLRSHTAPFFSLVSGKLATWSTYQDVSNTVEEKNINTLSLINQEMRQDESTLLATKEENSQLTTFSSAGAYYLNTKRTYRGLEQKLNQTPISVFEEGRKGVARGYVSEPPC